MYRFLCAAFLIAGCERAEPPKPPDPLDGVELPVVAGAGAIAGEAAHPLLVVTPAALALDGTPALALRDGVIDPAEKEGGALGMKVPKLVRRLAEVAGPHDGIATLAMDRRLTYRLMMDILYSAKQREAGWKRFALLARAHGKLVAFPITLPDKAAAAHAGGLIEKLDETSLTPAAVQQKIGTTYSAGIKRCYKKLLATDPRAGGTLTLGLTVTATGQVTKASARGIPALESCVTAAMETWRFPMPRDDRGQPTEASFQLKIILQGEGSDTPTPPAAILQSPPRVSEEKPEEIDPRMIISITTADIVLWSFTQLEGSLREPKLKVARSDPGAIAKLTGALAEIAKRRAKTTHTIVIQAEGATPLQTIAEVFDAARPAFPDLVLSSGFE